MCFIFYIFVTSFQLISGDVCLHIQDGYVEGSIRGCVYIKVATAVFSLCPHGNFKRSTQDKKLSYHPKVRSYEESKLSLFVCSFLMPETKQQESIEMFLFFFSKDGSKMMTKSVSVNFPSVPLAPKSTNDTTLGIRMSLFSCPIQP